MPGLFSFVGVAGFEPATPCSQSRCANRTALYPEFGCKCNYFWQTITSTSLLSKKKLMKKIYTIILLGSLIFSGLVAKNQETEVYPTKG